MTQRERLASLITEAMQTEPIFKNMADNIANYLLENGVIAIPYADSEVEG